MQFDQTQVFEYQTDWVEAFQDYLEKEKVKDEDRNLIKANIIEANQTIDELARRHSDKMKIIPSKENFFSTILLLDQKGVKHYAYLDTRSPRARFWTIHNISKKEKIQPLIDEIFCNNYLQDKIYLPTEAMDYYREHFAQYCLGMSLKFDSKLPISNSQKHLPELWDAGVTLRCWTKDKNTVNKMIESFREIDFPVRFNYINCVFEDSANQIVMKENLFIDGKFTIKKGTEFRTHLKFVNQVRTDYGNQMGMIEANRIDWDTFSGALFVIRFSTPKIDPRGLINLITQNKKEFRLHIMKLYRDGDADQYLCIDDHTGDKFYLSVLPEEFTLNLGRDTCGNVVFRLHANIQAYLDPRAQLYVDDRKISWKR